MSPNAPPVWGAAVTNTSTFNLDYSLDDAQSFLDAAHLSGLKGFQTGSESADPDWPLALKCALVDRARKRAGLQRSAACHAQMDKLWLYSYRLHNLRPGYSMLLPRDHSASQSRGLEAEHCRGCDSRKSRANSDLECVPIVRAEPLLTQLHNLRSDDWDMAAL